MSIAADLAGLAADLGALRERMAALDARIRERPELAPRLAGRMLISHEHIRLARRYLEDTENIARRHG